MFVCCQGFLLSCFKNIFRLFQSAGIFFDFFFGGGVLGVGEVDVTQNVPSVMFFSYLKRWGGLKFLKVKC